LHALLHALSPERLWQHVGLATPWLLDDALQEVEWAEAIFLSRATPQRGPSAPTHVRLAGHELGEEDEDTRDGEPVRRVPLSVPQTRQQPTEATTHCHCCGDCPSPVAKPRSRPPSGNLLRTPSLLQG